MKKYESTQEQDIESVRGKSDSIAFYIIKTIITLQKEQLTMQAKEGQEKCDAQQNQIEELERKIKVLEGDLEAAEDANEENKK